MVICMNYLQGKVNIGHEPELCPYCQSDLASNITVKIIESDLSRGWKLEGEGVMDAKCRCPRCGMIYNAVNKRIPIECGNYSCPNCNETSNLEYNVCKIEQNDHEFTFKAEIFCRKCYKKNIVIRALKKILNIRKIEITRNGITVERSTE